MKKSELVASVAEKCSEIKLTKKDAELVVSSVFESIKEALAKGEKVQLVGFGTFEVRERAARVCQNPKTHEKVEIAASKAPTFKAGQALKDSVN